jgi:hypothetical protein
MTVARLYFAEMADCRSRCGGWIQAREASVNILVDVALMAYEIDPIWGNE